MSKTTDSANVMPAPIYYIGAGAVGGALEAFFPSSVLTGGGTRWLAAGSAVVSIALLASAVRELRKAGTAFDVRKSSTAIVSSGAFRFTRNPTYLALTLLLVAIALTLNSAWLLASAVPALLLTHHLVVLPEERYLAAKFGADYTEYQARVRRWV